MNDREANVDLRALVERLRRFTAEREWGQFHDPKNLAMAIASEAGELLAELRWMRGEETDARVRDEAVRRRIEQEVADVAIALLLFCDRTGVDLLSAIDRKIDVNETRYPVERSRGRAERPEGIESRPGGMRVLAVDWSGAVAGGQQTIWLAEVVEGELVRLENGRSRTEVVDELIAMARADQELVVGLDFAFGFPEWFLDSLDVSSAAEMWSRVAEQGESWLQRCEPPFWGRPGKSRPDIVEHFRKTEMTTLARSSSQPKSVFQIGGAGAVGTGSIRGMAQLSRLQQAGFSIWPFDPSRLPLVVEIYPRLLTGPVVKSSAEARQSYLAHRYESMDPHIRSRVATSEDSFDAAVSALAMWDHRAELTSLPVPNDRALLREGIIWTPDVAGVV